MGEKNVGSGTSVNSRAWPHPIFLAERGVAKRELNIRNGKQLAFSVCGQTVKAPFVMRSSNKNDGQNILTPVAAVTTAPMTVTTPWVCGKEA